MRGFNIKEERCVQNSVAFFQWSIFQKIRGLMTLEIPAESFRALDSARAVIAGEVYSVCTPYSVLRTPETVL